MLRVKLIVDSTVDGKDNKSTFFMRCQLEGMGNLRKSEPVLAPVPKDSPWEESRGASEVRGAKKLKGGAKQQLEWWDVFVKWRVALVDSRPIRAQDIDSYKAAWCLFSPLLFCSGGSAASLPA